MSEPTGHTIDGTPWEEPRGPHLPDRLTALMRRLATIPLPVWPFVALAVVTTAEQWTEPQTITDLAWSVLGLIPSVSACLLGAAVFLRHPDALRTIPLVVAGVVLSALVPLLRMASPVVWSAIDGLAPVDDVMLAGSSLTVEVASFVGLSLYALFLSIVDVFAVLYLARGLDGARRSAAGVDRRLAWGLVAISILVTIAMATGYLGLSDEFGISNQPIVTAWLGVNLASMLAVSYLMLVAWTARSGGDRPSTGWALAAVSTALSIVGAASIAAFGLFRSDAYGPVLTTLGVLAPVSSLCMLAAFGLGLPATDETEPDEVAPAARPPDPPATTPPGSPGS